MRERNAIPTNSRSFLFWLLIVAVFTGNTLTSCAVHMNYLETDAPKYREDFADPFPRLQDTLTIVTFNIAYAKEIDVAIEELCSSPRLRDADVILLQEMDMEGTQQIAQTLKYNYVYYPAVLHPRYNKKFGNAILSKWPITDESKILLPHENPVRKQRRIAVSATITIENKLIKIFNVHNETILLRRTKKLDQVDALVEYISRGQDADYMIVGGDFNTVGQREFSTVAGRFEPLGLVLATASVGTTSKIFLRLDHIYTKGLRVIDAGKQRPTRASDHFPVWIQVERPS
ncbi:MAG: endonuclease/exonuclease/phosphatase family protein [Desulfomonilia bacterium]|nr:endonuclease/exonuclease/phosphatase family protein [Desulfomonilia bacterium]